MSTTVTYKGETLATVNNNTKTLKTAGKYMEDDVTLTDVSSTILVTETYDSGGGIIKTITTTGTPIQLQAKTINPTSSTQTVNPDTGYDGMSQVIVNAATGSTINNQNKTVSPSTSLQSITADSGYTGLGTVTVNAMPSGTAGTPTATKGTVSNHSINVTPSVTNTTGYITGSTISGTAVSVSASELVSGNKSITENGSNIDVTNYATVSVSVSGGGVTFPMFTIDLSSTPVSVTCDKTYSDCADLLSQNIGVAEALVLPYNITTSACVFEYESNYIKYVVQSNGIPVADIRYNSDGTLLYIEPSFLTGAEGTPIATKSGVVNHSVTVTPSVTNSGGYIQGGTKTGTAITVSASELASGTYSVTSSGTHDVTNYASAIVPSGSATPASTISATGAIVSTSTNTLTLTKSSVSNTPQVSAGYISSGTAGDSSVSLSATVSINPTPTASGATVTIPAGYYTEQTTKSVTTMTLPTSASASATSGYTSKATISRSTSDQYINIAPGYNSAGGYYKISAVANGSASGPTTVTGTAASVSTGTNTLTLTKTGVSTTPTVSAGYVASATSTTATVSLTASVTTKGATTYTPTTTNQTIASGTYLTGTQTISGDANLVASNIISTATIFGVTGNVVIQNVYTGSSAPSSSTGSNGDIYIQS